MLFDRWYQARISFLYDDMKPLRDLVDNEEDMSRYALALDISKNKIQERFRLSDEEIIFNFIVGFRLNVKKLDFMIVACTFLNIEKIAKSQLVLKKL